MADLRVPIDAALSAFGVPAVIQRPDPDAGAINTTGFWLPSRQEEDAVGHVRRRRDPRRVFVLTRTAIAGIPSGTTVLAPELLGETPKLWRFDGYDDVVEPDCLRLLLTLIPAPA